MSASFPCSSNHEFLTGLRSGDSGRESNKDKIKTCPVSVFVFMDGVLSPGLKDDDIRS